MKKIFALMGLIVGGVIGFFKGIIYQHKEEQYKIFRLENKADKFQSYYNVLVDWLNIRQSGENLGNKILKRGYKTIAIYGMGEMGKCLYADIEPNSVKVKYAIDSGGIRNYETIPVVGIDEVKNDVDAIIVTAVYDFEDIKGKLEKYVSCSIISLVDFIWDDNDAC